MNVQPRGYSGSIGCLVCPTVWPEFTFRATHRRGPWPGRWAPRCFDSGLAKPSEPVRVRAKSSREKRSAGTPVLSHPPWTLTPGGQQPLCRSLRNRDAWRSQESLRFSSPDTKRPLQHAGCRELAPRACQPSGVGLGLVRRTWCGFHLVPRPALNRSHAAIPNFLLNSHSLVLVILSLN